MEGAEFFMGEGYVPIERMLDSGHRMRSVLLHPKRLKRFIPTIAHPELAGVPQSNVARRLCFVAANAAR